MSRLSLYQYGILALPLAFAGLPLYLHIPDLYATQFGMSLATIGILLLAIRLFDAFQDPIIGFLTSRLTSNKSILSSIMLSMLIMLAASMYLLISPQEFLPTYIWFAIFMLLCTTAYSTLNIVYQSLGAIWCKDYHQRTKITTTREAIGLIGITLAAILPTLLAEKYGVQEAFKIFAIIFVALIAFVALIWLPWLKKVSFESLPKSKTGSLSFLKFKATRPLFIIWFLSQLSAAIPVVLVIFFVRDNLELENLLGAYLLIYFVSGALGMPLWRYIEKIKTKQFAWQSAMFLAIASFIWAYFLEAGDMYEYGLVCVFSGLALGAELGIPPSILADTISREKEDAAAAKYFGISTFLGKFALATASGLVLPIIAYWGYSPNSENSTEALHALAISYSIIPCAIKLMPAISLSFIKLEGEQNEKNKESN